ncbi:MAG: penicillin acylase family protein, partial [Planctomycetota bacterium]
MPAATEPPPPADSARPSRRRRRRRLWRLPLIGAGLALALAACVLNPPSPGSISLDTRLEHFPTDDLDLFAPAEVRWNEQAVPYLIVEDERDVPYLLGLTHGHLRRAQLEILRHIARGELSRLGGPFAKAIDALLRTLDLDRAVPQMVEELPDETRAWVERYVAGLNRQAQESSRRPADARLLGLDVRREWTAADVLTIARLASVDISLGRTIGLLGLRGQAGFD